MTNIEQEKPARARVAAEDGAKPVPANPTAATAQETPWFTVAEHAVFVSPKRAPATTKKGIALAAAKSALAEVGPGLTPSEHAALEAALWQLLAKQTAIYAGEDNCSVPKEIAGELLSSICFVLGLGPNPTTARTFLAANPDEAFERGVRAVEHRTARARQLWLTACRSLPRLESVSLRDTLRSVGTFWEKYDCRFFAHRVPCDIDYQLCLPAPEALQGVDYISDWLRRLCMENSFLRAFASTRCARLLQCACGDYKNLPVNLYEPVSATAIGLALLGTDVSSLELSLPQYARLEHLLGPLDDAALESALVSAAGVLSSALGLGGNESRAYLAQTAVSLAPRIRAALPHHELRGIFPALTDPDDSAPFASHNL